MGKLVEEGIETIEAIQQTVITGFEPDELQAYSGLLMSVVKAADTLNKINLQNKKDKTSKELKQMDIDKKQLSPAKGGNTNILVATREEIIERFLDNNKKAIEADVTDVEDVEDE